MEIVFRSETNLVAIQAKSASRPRSTRRMWGLVNKCRLPAIVVGRAAAIALHGFHSNSARYWFGVK